MLTSFPLADSKPSVRTDSRAIGLTWIERITLAVGVFEIPLQLDKYFFYHTPDAELGAIGGLNFSLTTISLIVLYATWIGSAAAKRTNVRNGALVLGVPMLAYIAFNVVSIWIAPVRMLAIFDVWLLAQAFLLFFYIANRVRTRSDLQFILLVVSAMVVFQGLVVIGLSALGSGAAGSKFQLGPATFSVREDGRPEGTMGSPNGAASVLYLLTTMTAPLVFIDRPRWLRGWGLLAIFLGVTAILLTETRGAILTLALGGALLGLGAAYRKWIPHHVMVLGVLAAMLATLPLAYKLSRRFRESDGDSAKSRIHLSAIALQAIAERPVFGCGAGNCHLGTAKFANQAEYRSEWFFTTHCKYLLVWVETGVFGFIAFLAMLFVGLVRSMNAWRSSDRFYAMMGLALLAATAGHMLHLLVDIFNSRVQIQTLWFTLAVATATAQIAAQQPRNRNVRQLAPNERIPLR